MEEIDRLKQRLVIDQDALSECLIEQPQLYYEVTNAHVRAVSLRDAAKLELEEIHARLDKAIRADADAAQTKITEARIQQEIHLDPKYQAKRKQLLELSERADRLQALRDAYSQRSFMLRELVALTIAERQDIARANGAGQQLPASRAALADSNLRATEARRQQFRVRSRAK